ncbi:DUF2591 domain protein [Proteus phage vB_PmiS_PM-CJR]|nr:DUF2591 domain protein [Proteus phage vB_PmiS_PM-CJR]
MTEFEINKKVAQKLGYIHTKSFDPCNNIEQAWYIMMKHNICVTRGDEEDYNAFLLLTLDGYEWFTEKMVSHKKPFVAAMLLFLEV